MVSRPYLCCMILLLTAVVGGGCASATVQHLSPISPLPSQSQLATPPTDVPQLPVFYIDEPLRAGDSTIHGGGPANLPVVLADVTMMGEVLGRGTIGSSGMFEIGVAELVTNHHIGLMLDPQKVDFYTSDIVANLEQRVGEGSMTFPHIGKVYVSAMVK